MKNEKEENYKSRPTETYKAMKIAYEQIVRNVPLCNNPALGLGIESREVMVACVCETRYRLLVEGNDPLPTLTKENAPVYCPFCGQHCSEYSVLFGHSGGVFNVSMMKIECQAENEDSAKGVFF